MHLNVEIKAKCVDRAAVRLWLLNHGADFRGTDGQTDTYFKIADGRLKLRQGNIENSLIHYQRPNQSGPKDSQVTMCHISEGAELKSVLEKALGVLVEVKKQREIYFIDNVKFHLDEVPGLGSFVEIEAIDSDGSIGKEKLLAQCEHYLQALGIQQEDLLHNSYSDMLLERL